MEQFPENPRDHGATVYRSLRINLEPLKELQGNLHQKLLQGSLDEILSMAAYIVAGAVTDAGQDTNARAAGASIREWGKRTVLEYVHGFMEAAREAGDSGTIDYVTPKLRELETRLEGLEWLQ
mgnify:CR=1 FL=1